MSIENKKAPSASGGQGFLKHQLNKAFAFNIVQAIEGEYPDFKIDYTKIQLSQGSQAKAGAASATSPTPGQLVFTWTNTGGKMGVSEDLVYIAAYNEELNHWVYELSEVQRKAGTITLDLTGLSGKPFHTYLGFISSTGLTSNTFYTGLVTVS